MTWELAGKSATFETDSMTARFDGNNPFRGLRIQSNGDAKSEAQLFSFLLSEPPVETYVRGDDLVSKYPPRNSDLVSYTTYHRYVTSDTAAAKYDGVQLILSAQTHLLDSAPLTQIVSEFENARLFYKPNSGGDLRAVEGEHVFADLAPQFFLVRHENDTSHSWVLLIHPTDFHRGAVRLEPAPTVTLHVFPDALEKGVIRRATLKCCRVNRDNDEQIASQLFETLESAAPPLTT